MKVPQLSVTDLDKEHELSDIQGQSLVARFTEANNEKVSLLVKGRSQPIDLPWTRFSDESIALLEGFVEFKKSRQAKSLRSLLQRAIGCLILPRVSTKITIQSSKLRIIWSVCLALVLVFISL